MLLFFSDKYGHRCKITSRESEKVGLISHTIPHVVFRDEKTLSRDVILHRCITKKERFETTW